MPAWGRAIGKVLVWVLVLLAPVQPILALDCLCLCKLASNDADQEKCQKTELRSNEHASCCHRCSNRASAATAVENGGGIAFTRVAERRLPGCPPCDCPQDCNCHLRHATRIGILPTPVTRVSNDLCGIPLGNVALCLPLPVYEERTDARPHNFFRETSALAVCALLCRFAS
jgi:hypothetical protein